jgi:hypothetical protein
VAISHEIHRTGTSVALTQDERPSPLSPIFPG